MRTRPRASDGRQNSSRIVRCTRSTGPLVVGRSGRMKVTGGGAVTPRQRREAPGRAAQATVRAVASQTEPPACTVSCERRAELLVELVERAAVDSR